MSGCYHGAGGNYGRFYTENGEEFIDTPYGDFHVPDRRPLTNSKGQWLDDADMD